MGVKQISAAWLGSGGRLGCKEPDPTAAPSDPLQFVADAAKFKWLHGQAMLLAIAPFFSVAKTLRDVTQTTCFLPS